jgi:transcriptional regulator with XRE-family HTH domain
MPRRTADKTYARKFGARVRTIRQEQALTQERLAWDCDIDKGFLSQVEAGKRIPSIPTLVALATRLGVGAADLLAFDLAEPRFAMLDACRLSDRKAVRDALRRLHMA